MFKILRSLLAIIFLYSISFPLQAQESLRNDGKMRTHSASTMAFYGDFLNEQTFNNNNGSIYFVGPALQTIQGFIKPLQFDKVILENSNSLLLRVPVFNTGNLDFRKGIIATPKATPSVNWTFGDDATYVNASNNRHVMGYVGKIGNDTFAFPIGDGQRLRVLSISSPSDVNSVFQSTYFKGSPSSATLPVTAPFPIKNVADTSALKISNEEYWDLDGSAPIRISLTWDALSRVDILSENDISRLVVAGWDGTQWVSLGATSVNGDLKTYGIVTSRLIVPDSFSVFTFGVTKKHCFASVPKLSLGKDTSLCSGQSILLNPGNFYSRYEWQNGGVDSSLTVSTSGTYWVKAWDICGNYQVDTLQILRGREVTVTAMPAKCNTDTNGAIQLSDTSNVVVKMNNEVINLAHLSNLSVGNFHIEVSAMNGCVTDTTVEVKSVQSFNTVEIGKDTIHIIEGNTVALTPTLSTGFNPTKVAWVPAQFTSCDTCLNTSIKPTVTATYIVEATDSLGCVAKDNVTIYVDYKSGLYMPNVFNPDIEGYTIIGTSVIEVVIRIQIFDRWGTLLFEAKNFKPDGSLRWNGMYKNKPLMRGTYVATVEAKYVDGTINTFATEFLLTR